MASWENFQSHNKERYFYKNVQVSPAGTSIKQWPFDGPSSCKNLKESLKHIVQLISIDSRFLDVLFYILYWSYRQHIEVTYRDLVILSNMDSQFLFQFWFKDGT